MSESIDLPIMRRHKHFIIGVHDYRIGEYNLHVGLDLSHEERAANISVSGGCLYNRC